MSGVISKIEPYILVHNVHENKLVFGFSLHFTCTMYRTGKTVFVLIRPVFFPVMDTFSVTSKAVSERGNRYMQLFVSDTGFMYTYPMKEKTEIVNAVKSFAKEIGVLTALILDPEGTQRSKELNMVTTDMRCP